MIEKLREPIRSIEAARLSRVQGGAGIRSLLTKPKPEGPQKWAEHFVDTYRISVERCFIPMNFNEELPLYILDLGGMLLILFGQWMFDPHTLIVSTNSFENWVCDQNFFAKFSLRGSSEQGIVFELRVEETSFIEAERLITPLRFNRLREY